MLFLRKKRTFRQRLLLDQRDESMKTQCITNYNCEKRISKKHRKRIKFFENHHKR